MKKVGDNPKLLPGRKQKSLRLFVKVESNVMETKYEMITRMTKIFIQLCQWTRNKKPTNCRKKN